MPNGTSDPVEEARYAYDRVQRDIGFDPGDPRLMADGTYREADRLFAALEAAIVQREAAKMQTLREALKRAEKIVASFVKARDAFHYDNFGGEVERHLERAMEDAYGFLHGLPDDLRATLAGVTR